MSGTDDRPVRTEQQPPELMTDILGLEQLEVDIFRGRSPDEDLQRVFGGQVAGQALVAAGRTVPEARPVHSLHAYFLRPGDPTVPIVYTVDRIRDGRTFTTRRVVAIQHGRAIFTLSASFHVAEPGADHQFDMPSAPDPATVPLWQDRLREFGDSVPSRWLRPRPVEVRYVGDPPWAGDRGDSDPRTMVWMRSVGPLPDDPLLHVCTVVYASDMTLLDSVLRAQGVAWAEDSVTGASLDHAMWFHAPFRADEWLLYVQEAPVTSSARGLARGHIYRQDGRLAASVVQEGLVRVVSPDR